MIRSVKNPQRTAQKKITAESEEEANCYVFVGGLKANFTEDILYEYFNAIGKVESINLKKKKKSQVNRGFCIVKFQNSKIVGRVLKMRHHFIQRRKVSCRKYLSGDKLKESKAQKNNKTIYISELPKETTNEHIYELFEKFGNIETGYTLSEVETGESKGFGFVTFEEEGIVELVLEAKESLKILGASISVEKYGAHKLKDKEDEKEDGLESEERDNNIVKKREDILEDKKRSSVKPNEDQNMPQRPLNQLDSFKKKQEDEVISKIKRFTSQIPKDQMRVPPYYGTPQRLVEGNINNQRFSAPFNQNKIRSSHRENVCLHHPYAIKKTLKEHQMLPTRRNYHQSFRNSIAKSWHDINISNLKLRRARPSQFE